MLNGYQPMGVVMKTAAIQRGFTIIGLLGVMVVILIRGFFAVLMVPIILIGMLGVLVVVVVREIFSTYMVQNVDILRDEDRESAVKLDIENLTEALMLYRLDNQCYPVTEQGLQALSSRPTIAPFPTHWKAGGYLKHLPKDPWGNPYQYLNPGVRGEIDIFSLGAVDVPGREGTDTDIRLLVSQGKCSSGDNQRNTDIPVIAPIPV